jgi:hypothetical protein
LTVGISRQIEAEALECLAVQRELEALLAA